MSASLIAAGPGIGAATPASAAPLAAANCPANHGLPLPHPVGISSTNIGGCGGYVIANKAGRVSAFGSATNYGDMAGYQLNAPIISVATTPDGRGYWLVAADGGVFSFGDAAFHGSTGGQRLNAPVVGIAATPDGRGYWLVAADGGVFSFGDAAFYGSMGDHHLNAPVTGIAAAPGGNGYWLVARDGGVFTFTADGFYGSMGGRPLNAPMVSMVSSKDGRGYFMVAADGGVFAFGDASFKGSLGASPPPTPVVGLAVTPDSVGYYAMDALGNVYQFGSAPSFGGATCPANNPSLYGVDPNVMADDGGGSQLLTISDPGSSSVSGTATAWTRPAGGCWTPMTFGGQPAQPYRAETGYGGIIPDANRVGGDGATPEGVFGFGPTMYGVSTSAPNPAYRYQHLTCGSWWDEAPGSPTYDSFQQYPCGVTPPFAYSAEALWTETVAYVHFADILTPNPPQNSAGIFLHDDTTAGDTAGCVALPPGELDAVLGWLNPAARPHIIIGTAAVMNSL